MNIYDRNSSAIRRMNVALNRTVDVYTEINLDTFQYQQINLCNEEFFNIASSGDYAEAFEYMCQEEIYSDDVPAVRQTLQKESLLARARDDKAQKKVSVRYRLKNSDPLQVMESMAVFVLDEDSRYVVVLAKDVTEVVKLERQHEYDKISQRATQEHLDAIMHMNPNAVTTFRLNVTKNTCGNGLSRYEEMLSLQNQGTVDGYVKGAFKFIPYETERKAFAEKFYQDKLLTAFNQGCKQVEMKHHCVLNNDQMYSFLTAVSLTQNISTGDVEGILYTLDITQQEQNASILHMLFDREYEGRAIINAKKRTYSLFRFDYDPEIVDKALDLDYDKGIQRLVRKYVCEDEKESYLRKADLDNIVRELERTGSFSFTATYQLENKEKKYKKIFYCYADEFHNEIFCVMEDITELTKREQEQVQMLRESVLVAEEANEAKTLFLSSISHDLRTPLNAVLGFAELAKEKDSEEEKSAYLNKITQSGQLLLALINDTLSISKIETGKMTLEYQDVHLVHFVQSMLGIFAIQSKEKHIKLNTQFYQDKDYVLRMDLLRTKQVLLNIVSNAIKFTEEGGSVSILQKILKDTDRTIKIRTIIRDTGVGISEDFLPHIFESYSQENVWKNKNYSGTGLGMAITKGIVDLMGGRIEVKSKLGEGTEFIVDLEFEKAQETPIMKLPQTGYVSILEGKRILYCEDHPLNRELGERILEKVGVLVETADNGQAGLEAFKESPEGYYDAILMDIRMPVMDGLQATKAIRKTKREDAKQIPIIAMTANAYDEEKRRMFAARMTGHIAKPINVKELYNMLSTQIDEYQSVRSNLYQTKET